MPLTGTPTTNETNRWRIGDAGDENRRTISRNRELERRAHGAKAREHVRKPSHCCGNAPILRPFAYDRREGAFRRSAYTIDSVWTRAETQSCEPHAHNARNASQRPPMTTEPPMSVGSRQTGPHPTPGERRSRPCTRENRKQRNQSHENREVDIAPDGNRRERGHGPRNCEPRTPGVGLRRDRKSVV